MAGTAAPRKSRPASRAAKPRTTVAQKRAADEQQAATEQITPSVHRLHLDAPDVPGGAVTVDTKSVPAAVERDTLFYVDGAGYTIPKSFGKIVTLRYAHVARTQGLTAAIDWAMEQALGTVGYAVLLDQTSIADEQLDSMMALVMIRMEGLADPKS